MDRGHPDGEHGASWLHSKGSVVMPDFNRANSSVSAGAFRCLPRRVGRLGNTDGDLNIHMRCAMGTCGGVRQCTGVDIWQPAVRKRKLMPGVELFALLPKRGRGHQGAVFPECGFSTQS